MPTNLDAELRIEADQLLASGLRQALEDYGDVHIIGSYALRLMTWRDLDIHVVPLRLDVGEFFELGSRIAACLRPHRMHYRDETVVATPGLPVGLYWGVYLGDERQGSWKIDVWASQAAAFEKVRVFGQLLETRLSERSRSRILEIKSACWQHPEYRRGFSSADIYAAVLDHNVIDIHGFWEHLRAKGKAV